MQFLKSHKFNTTTKIISFFVCLLCFLFSPEILQAQKKYVIVLDAGHGGKDPGNLGNGYKEKHIALKVTLLVGKELQKEKDIKVVYTRTRDVLIELHNRAKIANKKNADLFVSIHCDSHTSKAFGAGTFVLGLRGNKRNLEIAKRENASILLEEDYKSNYDYDPNSPESLIGLSLLQEENLDKSLEIASLIQKNFIHLKRHDRKVKQDIFLVLRNTIMPSVLVELGFLTNRREGRYLNSKKGQRQMAKAVANAIKKYVKRLKLNTIDKSVVTTLPVANAPIFKIQIASGSSKIATKAYNFKGLKNVERVKVGRHYKYYYGENEDYNTVKKSLRIAKKKGYRSAFIVAFKDGEKISVSKALKMQ